MRRRNKPPLPPRWKLPREAMQGPTARKPCDKCGQLDLAVSTREQITTTVRPNVDAAEQLGGLPGATDAFKRWSHPTRATHKMHPQRKAVVKESVSSVKSVVAYLFVCTGGDVF